MLQPVTNIQHETELGLWEREYEAQFLRIYNFFFYQFNDEPIAKDLTSATFEEAWKSRKRYNAEKGAYSTWLFAIARQQRALYYRKKKFVQTEISPNLVDDSPSLDALVEQQFLQEKLQAMVAELSQKEQEIVALRFGAGMIHSEIAEIMNLSDANVRKILSRVVKKLRARWEVD